MRYQQYILFRKLRNNKLHFTFLLLGQLTFIMTSYRSKPFGAALNSPAKGRLKNCWKPATLLKMNFIKIFFKDCDCKGQNTYVLEYVLVAAFENL